MSFVIKGAAIGGLMFSVLAAAQAPESNTSSARYGQREGNTSEASERPESLSTLQVIGQPTPAGEAESVMRSDAAINDVDTAALLRGVPGANFVNNGPLSGQAQYRGMFGDRVAVRVDGMPIVSGGPNWMDAPLHYAPKSHLTDLRMYRGIAPVSAGAETIGGAVLAETRRGRFTSDDAFELDASGSANYQSNGDVRTGDAFVALANRHHRLYARAEAIDGNDREFSSGRRSTIAGTRAEKISGAFGYAIRRGEHELSIDLARHETDDTGNPSLPSDIRFIDTDLAKLDYAGALGSADIEARISYQDVAHVMTNFDLRPAPDFFTPPPNAPMPVQMAFGGVDRRLLDVTSETVGAGFEADMPLLDGRLLTGFDVLLSEHSTDVLDPDSPFFVQPFQSVERDRYSGFGEWRGKLSPRLELGAGARVTHVTSDAGEVIAPPLPPAQALKERFNAADRSRGDTMIDASVIFQRLLGERLSASLGLARKSRAPSYIERYAWVPIEATAGLADGNNHVGRLDLDPEVAHEINLGLTFGNERLRLSPQVFYRRVDDYIQGTPAADPAIIMVSTVNGDPTPLQYTNVDAEFYGLDTDFGYRFNARWTLDGSISYVRARRRDISDDLYRIAPLNGDLVLTYAQGRWRVALRSIWAAAQNRVSSTNSEPTTGSFAIVDLAARFDLTDQLRLRAGIGNLLDDRYADHLAGFNRIIGSDVGQPAPPPTRDNRIPGIGRNFYIGLALDWGGN